MVICPAIDLLGGKAVRLVQGDFDQSKVYDDDPLEAARRWVAGGARRLHIVDLDGAREGGPINMGALGTITEELHVPVQYGGGLRSLAHMDAALAAGAERVVLGTAAFRDAQLLERAVQRWDGRVAVSVDVRAGRVATAAWLEQTELSPQEAIRLLRQRGVTSFIFTSIDRDGTLSGLDTRELGAVAEAVGSDRFLYSGGIASLDDLREVVALGLASLEGVVVGKALYEARFTVAEAQALLDGGPRARREPGR